MKAEQAQNIGILVTKKEAHCLEKSWILKRNEINETFPS